MDITTTHAAPVSPVPPFDLTARDRIEQVVTALIDLNARLEMKLDDALARVAELEDAMTQLGLVQVPR